MNNFASKRLLFDTNAPTLLVKSSSSTKKASKVLAEGV